MPPRKQKAAKEEQITLGPQLAEGENNFGVAHIFASFNDTFVHVTDLSGRSVLNIRPWGWIYNVIRCCYMSLRNPNPKA